MSLIAIISLAGVMLGTFALSVDLAVMSGFEEDLHQRLLAFTPHLTIQSPPQQPPDTTQDGALLCKNCQTPMTPTTYTHLDGRKGWYQTIQGGRCPLCKTEVTVITERGLPPRVVWKDPPPDPS